MHHCFALFTLHYCTGVVPNSICLLTKLGTLEVTGGNPGVTCAPYCVTSVATRYLPAPICVYPQDVGLCGLIAATDVSSISGYSKWSCTTGGFTSTTPCLTGLVWPGLSCVGLNIVALNVTTKAMTGKSFQVLQR